jgi:hypothetical protein
LYARDNDTELDLLYGLKTNARSGSSGTRRRRRRSWEFPSSGGKTTGYWDTISR